MQVFVLKGRISVLVLLHTLIPTVPARLQQQKTPLFGTVPTAAFYEHNRIEPSALSVHRSS